MQADAKKFMITISLCAMLAVNPVLATAPENDEDLGNVHEVYVESSLNKATNGIASVGYVNRMVDAAGGAATRAEEHAAVAGEYAIAAGKAADEAKGSADAAQAAMEDKLDKSQGADNKNMVMVTDEEGTVYPGYITSDMIETTARQGLVLKTDGKGNVFWGEVTSSGIAAKAIVPNNISGAGPYCDGCTLISTGNGSWVKWGHYNLRANDIVLNDSAERNYYPIVYDHGNTGITLGKIRATALTTLGDNAQSGDVMISTNVNGSYDVGWGKIGSASLADGAVTNEKISAGFVDGSGNYYGAGMGQVLVSTDGAGSVDWGQVGGAGIADGAVTAAKIDDGAVTAEKTNGVIGAVPVGSKESTTYGAFWIE